LVLLWSAILSASVTSIVVGRGGSGAVVRSRPSESAPKSSTCPAVATPNPMRSLRSIISCLWLAR